MLQCNVGVSLTIQVVKTLTNRELCNAQNAWPPCVPVCLFVERDCLFTRQISKMEGPMNLFRNYRNWRRMRTTMNELSRLSSRELNDIGITRADIARVARQGS